MYIKTAFGIVRTGLPELQKIIDNFLGSHSCNFNTKRALVNELTPKKITLLFSGAPKNNAIIFLSDPPH